MSPRERQRDDGEQHRDNPHDGGSHEPLDEARAAGERFLAAGDEAIRRALSGDSQAFLRANRQRGGE
jgi:hypothetical protein